MRMSPNELRRDTLALIREIDAQIEEVKKEAKIVGRPPETIRDRNGSWSMSPLLVAKAQALNALVLLQTQGTR